MRPSILIADDHQMFVEALRSMLSPTYDVVATASNGRELTDLALRHKPNLIVTDKRGANGKMPSVGDTVDVSRATWTNTIGDPELITVWKDPEFNPSQRAFYYLRVLEIPTPRWTDYDSVRFGVKLGPEVPMKHQERAWTSPIWYTPTP